MVKSARLQQCAEKLSKNDDFKNLLIQHIAHDIHLHITRIKPELAEKNGDFSKAVTPLRKLLKNFFTDREFWEEKAAWILSSLDAWSLEGKEPEPLPNLLQWFESNPKTISKRESYLINLCAFKTAGEIIHELNLYSLEAEALLTLLGIAPKPVVPATDHPLFQTDDDTKIMTSQPYLTGVQACFGAELWEDINGIPCFRRFFGKGFIEHNIIKHHPEPNRLELVAGNAAWEIINKLGIETAYIFLIFASYATELKNPWQGTFSFKATDIIKMGIFHWHKRTDLKLSQKLKKLGELAQQVASLSIAINNLDLKRMTYTAEIQAMWRLELQYIGQLSLTLDHDQPNQISYQPEEPTELIITAGPNDWVKAFQATGNLPSLYEYGFLAKSTLLINPYRQPMAAALAVLLTIMSRIKVDGKYKVKTLLNRLGYLAKDLQLQELQNNRRQRGEWIERWDNALLTLHDLGWQIEFDPNTYPESIQPLWKLERSKNPERRRRPRNWLELWLEANLVIKPTPSIQAKLEKIKAKVLPASQIEPRKSKKSAKGTNEPKPLPGWALAKALELKGWTYSQLAKQLGLHKSLPGKWIRGERQIKSVYLKLIWQWLSPELHQVLDSQTL